MLKPAGGFLKKIFSPVKGAAKAMGAAANPFGGGANKAASHPATKKKPSIFGKAFGKGGAEKGSAFPHRSNPTGDRFAKPMGDKIPKMGSVGSPKLEARKQKSQPAV